MGRVIKASRSGPAVSSVSPVIKVIKADVFAARQDAHAIRAQATADAEAIRQRAYAEGFAQGQTSAAGQLFDLARMRSQLIESTQRDTARAALLVAAELLGCTLEREPEHILHVLAPHLSRMRRSQQLIVRLHPDDAAWLSQHHAAWTALCESHELAGSVSVRADAGIARGGCILDSNLGELDARVETRLQLIAAALGLDTEELT